MKNNTFKILFFTFLPLILVGIFPRHAKASGACIANVSVTTVQANTTTPFTFSVTNTGSAPVIYIKLLTPSTLFNLQASGVSGWSIASNSSMIELSEGSLAPSTQINLTFNVRTGGTESPAANWGVVTNDGSGEVSCTGNLSTAISGVADINPPVLDTLSVGNITNSSATISWTTDEPASSNVTYGLTADLGTEKNDGTLVTTHHLNIDGLATNTTYYYIVTSVDASGNASSFDYNLLTTAAVAITLPTTTSTIVVSTPSPTPRPSTGPAASAAPIVVVDITKPTAKILTVPAKSYEKAPKIEGSATDNKIVTDVEYSTDAGANWLPVDSAEGKGTASVTFSFVPQLPEDGNYSIQVRATDNSGNKGVSEPITIVIDRLPPRVGGSLLSIGPYSLLPNKDGVIVTLVGIEEKITLSAVGGATSIDLTARRTISAGSGRDRMFSLGKSAETGLWRGVINFAEPGVYELRVHAVDGAGNETERKLGVVLAIRAGQITSSLGKKVEGTLTLYHQDPQSELWTMWDAASYQQTNPQKISDSGTYKYFLPPGTYYIEINSPGHAKLLTQIFTFTESSPLNADFALGGPARWHLGPISIPLPYIFSEKAVVRLNLTAPGEGGVFDIVGKEAPAFTLPTSLGGEVKLADYRGDVRVLTFVNTWSPQSLEQVTLIDKDIYDRNLNDTFIVAQENVPKTAIFAKRGGYLSSFAVDRDGALVEGYGLSAIPSHYFVDRTGTVRKVVVGVMTSAEIKLELDSIR